MKYIKNPFILAFISGILCILSFQPFNFSFLIWFALIPLIYALTITPHEKKWFFKIPYFDGLLAGIVFGLVFYIGSLHWLYNIFGVSGIFLLLLMSIYPYLFCHLFNYLYNKFNKKILIIFLPASLWTAIEYIKSEAWWLKFSWMNLGYSQHNFLPALQFAGILGQYGLTFLILIVNSIIVYILVNRNNRIIIAKSIISLALIITFVLSYGFIQLKNTYSPDINVALIQDESSDFSIFKELISEIDTDVDFIVLPEYALREYLDDNTDRLNEIKKITKQHDSYLIVGSKDRASDEQDPEFYNTAYMFNPDGDIAGRFYKMNPIQFFDDGNSGKEYFVSETEYGKVGIFICYDTDYSFVARNTVKNGAELLLVPTYDPIEWGVLEHKQHSSMTSVRAVENGRFIAKTSTSGISQIIDPNGRITDEIGIRKSGITIGAIQKISKKTIYTRIGFLLPFVCIIISLTMILISIFKKNDFSET